MSKKNPKFYRVKDFELGVNTTYASRTHGGKIGILKYDNASFSKKQSGFEAVLVFPDGTYDGFCFSELVFIGNTM